MSDIDDRAVESVVKQFRGGEHALAGRRASELVYGGGKKPNQKLLDAIVEGAPGIDRYIAAPDTVTNPIADQGGNPLATQPENDPQQNNPSNLSSDEAKQEQAEIDDHLAAGREAADEAGADADAALGNQDVGTTKLNPDASDEDDKPAERLRAERDARKAGKQKPGA